MSLGTGTSQCSARLAGLLQSEVRTVGAAGAWGGCSGQDVALPAPTQNPAAAADPLEGPQQCAPLADPRLVLQYFLLNSQEGGGPLKWGLLGTGFGGPPRSLSEGGREASIWGELKVALQRCFCTLPISRTVPSSTPHYRPENSTYRGLGTGGRRMSCTDACPHAQSCRPLRGAQTWE